MTTADATGTRGSESSASSGSAASQEGPSLPNCDAAYSHARDIQPIWDAYCTADCHEVGGEQSSLDLSTDAYGAIVSTASSQNQLMNYVTEHAPEDSYLWHKLLGTQDDPGGGRGIMMPKARPMMDAMVVDPADLETVTCWILTGAEP